MTRAEKRSLLNNFNACCELHSIIKHFFPVLITQLNQVEEHRHPSYITYESKVVLFVRILAAVFQIGSMRKISEELNHCVCIENTAQMLNIKDLDELPHWSTINDFLEWLQPTELENIISKLVSRLIRMRSFENSRIRNKYWQILIDGTNLCSFDKRHCSCCLTREHKDKDGNVIRTDYYHAVLEAKLVLNGNIVISIATEFIENDGPNASKQDCELKAFYRLVQKLKHWFPRLPICLSMDSLYACNPVFDICKQNGWHYIIRFKDGSLPSVAEEFHTLKTMDPDHFFTKTILGVTKTYSYVTNIPYQSHILNVIEFSQSDMKYPFTFVTDLPISKYNYERLVDDGRRRWKIENEGFNIQKNHGFELGHLFSEDYNAMKNHYLLIQIGHMIAQIFEKAFEIWKSIKAPDYSIFDNLKRSFQTFAMAKADIMSLNRKRQFRFP